MKRYYLLMFCLICFSGIAQGQTTMDLLKAHTWRSENGIYYTKFDSQFMYEFSDYSSHGIDLDNYPYKANYHLSNSHSGPNFQPALVGTVTNGKYIIVPAGGVLEIVKISSAELQLKPLYTTGGRLVKYTPYTGPLPAEFLQLLGPISTGIDYRITNELPDGLNDINIDLWGTVLGQTVQLISSSPPDMPRPGQSATYSGNTFSLPAGTVIGDLQLRLYVNGNSGGTTRIVVRNGAHAAENIGDIGGGYDINLYLGSYTVPSSGRHSIDITVSVD